MFDPNNLPISGGLFLVGILYVVVAMFFTGPTIGSRTIEKSGFLPRCEKSLIKLAAQDAPDLQTPAPSIDCNRVMGLFAGPEARQFCDAAGFLFENPVTNQIEIQNQRLKTQHQERIRNAAANASTACECAKNVQLENRVPWALVAGSLRFVVPSEIKNLESELFEALNSPTCAGRFQ
ncbi:hypothetical protein [Maritalea sp.]|jgi:hypothetical protein|uniref:hypothetical protein n=1 Tax=Maritalea sp. TaxID=2003361 RepID=UPI0039E371A0